MAKLRERVRTETLRNRSTLTESKCESKLKLNAPVPVSNNPTANVSESAGGTLQEQRSFNNSRTRTNLKHIRRSASKWPHEDLSTPEKTSTTKVLKCVVRLKRVSFTASKNQLQSILATPKVRECRVRLHQIPISIENYPNRNARTKRRHMPDSQKNVHKNGSNDNETRPVSKRNQLLTEVEKTLKRTNPIKSKETLLNFELATEMEDSLRKISLGMDANKSVTSQLNNTHDISNFEPIRNSTVFDCEVTTNTIIEDTQLETTFGVARTNLQDRKSCSPNAKSFRKHRNHAKHDNVIEQLLNSDDADDVSLNTVMVYSNKTHKLDANQEDMQLPPVNKAHKFFHTKDLTTIDSNARDMKNITASTLKKRKLCAAKKLTPKKSIYEFLSQSETSNAGMIKNTDPAADIIQKLIRERKVCVATTRRGTGRPVIKRMTRQCKRPAAAKRNEVERTKKVEGAVQMAVPEFEEHFDNVEELKSPSSSYTEEEQAEPPILHLHESRSNDAHSSNAAFSRLARSVLISQTDKNDVSRELVQDKRRLLEVARKFVSTPVNSKIASQPKKTNISPIVSPVKTDYKQVGNASPWRVADDTHMPSVSYFSRNSSNLPSFSSDFMPPTPSKNNRLESSRMTNSASLSRTRKPISEATERLYTLTTPSSGLQSSYCSNDSNAENISPPQATLVPTEGDANADIFNLRQLPNPRRTLNQRIPLKPINILEIVTLPPWKSATNKNKDARKAVEVNQIACNNIPKVTAKDNSKDDLFGFEDSLQNDDDLQETGGTSDAYAKVSSDDFRERLHNLKKLRPKNDELPQSPAASMAKVFDENTGKRLRNIKEMFCSTMIHPKTRPLDNEENVNDEDQQTNTAKKQKMDLFNNTDPQLSFNENVSHRTYLRSLKRKRKLRHNFVFFLDSDQSEEEESHEFKGEDDKNADHPKKKHQRHAQKTSSEMKTFVKEFNNMCQEVEGYNLVVE